jgi:hypothetical protein
MQETTITKLKRLDRVIIHYRGFFLSYHAEGLVDKITGDAIYIGNRYVTGADGTRVIRPDKYKIERISSLRRCDE